MSMGRILVVEDYQDIRENLVLALEASGYQVEQAADGLAALQFLKTRSYDLILSDLKMPKLDGLELLKASRKLPQPPAFVMITAHGSIPDAVEAVNSGAADFLEKPFDLEELEYKVAAAIGAYAPLGSGEKNPEGFVAHSPAMLEILATIRGLAETKLSLFIQGAPGTGKEKAAKLLHQLSQNLKAPYICLDPLSPSDQGFESDLFGHEKSTSRSKSRKGALEQAAQGTLVIKNADALDVQTQYRLLQLLEKGEFKRQDGKKTLQVCSRIVLTSSQDLASLIKSEDFREDLYYRFHAHIKMPSLYQRKEDFPALLQHFLKEANTQHKKSLTLTPRAEKLLRGYSWPGNLRELESSLNRLVALASGPSLSEADLPEPLRHSASPGDRLSLPQEIEALEKARIHKALENHDWNQTHAAEALGIGRTALQYKIQKYGFLKPK